MDFLDTMQIFLMMVADQLYNIAVVICFALLSVHFGLWWIMLFAIFLVKSSRVHLDTSNLTNDGNENE